MQTFQMAIMLMFEKTNFLSCAEIQEALKLSFDQFQRHACSLLECKLLNSDTEVSTLFYYCLPQLIRQLFAGINTTNHS